MDQEHWSSLSQRSSAACVRRLALHGGSNQGQNSNLQSAEVAHVRSINAFLSPIISMTPPLSSFQVLRVLSLKNCRQVRDLRHLGKVLQLRHLGLSGTPVDELPRDIRNLVHLQSLDVLDTGLKELPSTVGELSNLMYLRLRPRTEVLPWLGKLTSLQVLKYGRYRSSVVAELGKLTELRILWISFQEVDESDVKALEESLHHLHKIEDVCLSASMPICLGTYGPLAWEPPRQIREFGWHVISLPRLPVWLKPKRVPHLSHLDLKLKAFEAQDMDIIGSLPELRDLTLDLHMGRIVSWTFPGGGLFPKLKTMWLVGIHVKNVDLLEIKNIRVTHEEREYYSEDEEVEDDDHDVDDEEETAARDPELQKHVEEKDVLAAGNGVAKLSL